MKRKFKKAIRSDIPTLVYFYTSWCSPCQMMKPLIQQLEEELGNDLIIIEIDVEHEKGIVQKYKVKSVPTLILFKNGIALWRHAGALPYLEIKKEISEFV